LEGRTEEQRSVVARYCLVKGILVIKLKLRRTKGAGIRWPAFEENPAVRSMNCKVAARRGRKENVGKEVMK